MREQSRQDQGRGRRGVDRSRVDDRGHTSAFGHVGYQSVGYRAAVSARPRRSQPARVPVGDHRHVDRAATTATTGYARYARVIVPLSASLAAAVVVVILIAAYAQWIAR